MQTKDFSSKNKNCLPR